MKKFTKFCVGTIITLGFVGAVLLGNGLCTVGWDEIAELVEEVSDGTIHFKNGFKFEGEALKKIGEHLKIDAKFNINDASMFDKSQEVWQGNVKKTKISGMPEYNLDLELAGCFFQIRQSEDYCYYVEYEGEGKTQVYDSGTGLCIKVLNASTFDFSEDENCFTLYVPKDSKFWEVDIKLGAGEMNLDKLNADELKIELGAGRITARELVSNNTKISVGAGDIDLQDTKLGKVKVEVGAGNCTIQGTVSEELKAECAMGDITLKLEGEEEDFDYELECVSGNLKVGDTKYSGLSGSKEVDNDAPKKMDLQCVMGNIEVEFE